MGKTKECVFKMFLFGVKECEGVDISIQPGRTQSNRSRAVNEGKKKSRDYRVVMVGDICLQIFIRNHSKHGKFTGTVKSCDGNKLAMSPVYCTFEMTQNEEVLVLSWVSNFRAAKPVMTLFANLVNNFRGKHGENDSKPSREVGMEQYEYEEDQMYMHSFDANLYVPNNRRGKLRSIERFFEQRIDRHNKNSTI